MTRHRWYTIFPGSQTVAALSEKEAYEIILRDYSVEDLIADSEIEDTTDQTRDIEYLEQLDRGDV